MTLAVGGAAVVETRRRGWDVLRLRSGDMEIDLVPGKGCDIVAARCVSRDVDVLWSTPWGLRPPSAIPLSDSPEERFLESYPGGWQMIFPNGGDPSAEGGVTQGFHGEAALAPWDVVAVTTEGEAAVAVLETRLVRSPFRLRRRITLDGDGLLVEESVLNEGSSAREVMWSHHPAFGAPFLDPSCTVATGARRILVDDLRVQPNGELERAATGEWPHVAGRDGSSVDLSRVPAPDAGVIRFGYLTDFDGAWYAIGNPRLGVEAHVSWDADTFPHAWYWLDAGGTEEYPWFGRAYVLAIEPASSHPGRGIEAVKATTGTQLRIDAGERRDAWVRLRLEAGA